MWTRPFGEMLIDVAGSLLGAAANQQLVRATAVDLRLPVEVKLKWSRRDEAIVFCADVPAWRWQTDWDRPCGEVRLRLEEVSLENEHE